MTKGRTGRATASGADDGRRGRREGAARVAADASADTAGAVRTPATSGAGDAELDLAPLARHPGWFAVDRLLFRYRSKLHTELIWEVTPDGLVATGSADLAQEALGDVPELTLVALTHELEPVPPDAEPTLIDSAAAVAKQIEGNIAERMLRVLYRIANDPPYYRQPLIEVDINQLLDELGYERARDGYHEPHNRARVRDVLLALARVELRGQMYDPVAQIRDLYVAPLIALRGGRYRFEETRDISVEDLMEKGLPLSLRIELGWYAGIRRPDGQLGNNFALLPRDLAFYQGLPPADQIGMADRLAEFLWLRYSYQRGASRDIVVTLGEALSHSGIFYKNTTRARERLAVALAHLSERGQIERHTPLPRGRNSSFVVTLRLPPPHGDPTADLPQVGVEPATALVPVQSDMWGEAAPAAEPGSLRCSGVRLVAISRLARRRGRQVPARARRSQQMLRPIGTATYMHAGRCPCIIPPDDQPIRSLTQLAHSSMVSISPPEKGESRPLRSHMRPSIRCQSYGTRSSSSGTSPDPRQRTPGACGRGSPPTTPRRPPAMQAPTPHR
jgi:hypothetical protein